MEMSVGQMLNRATHGDEDKDPYDEEDERDEGDY